MQVTHHYQRVARDHQHRRATTRRVSTLVPLSGKKARHALGLVPSRIVDASSLPRASPLVVHRRRDPPSLPSSSFPSPPPSLHLLLHPVPLSLSLLGSLLRGFALFLLSPEVSLSLSLPAESSGYTARFISYPANWEARTASGIPERRFPPPKGMRYREVDATQRDDIPESPTSERARTRTAAHLLPLLCSRRVPRRRRVFSITARRAVRCSGSVN